ncbi:MAG: Internalin-A [Chlamydiae bacterium]|nr:Internalin-A [Chlamydiota bacterium]
MSVSNSNHLVPEYVSLDEGGDPHKRSASVLDGEESQEKRLKTAPTSPSESEWSIPEELKEGILALIEDSRGSFPLELLTDNLIAEVLSHLDFPELNQIRCVNRRLNSLSKCDVAWEKIAGKIGVPIRKESKRNAQKQITEYHCLGDWECWKNDLPYNDLLIEKISELFCKCITIEKLILRNQFFYSSDVLGLFSMISKDNSTAFYEKFENLIWGTKIKPDGAEAVSRPETVQEMIILAQKASHWLEENKNLLSSMTKLDPKKINCILHFIPSEIRYLSSLKSLELVAHFITVIPSEIRYLSSLAKLKLSSNQLIAIPPEIGKLSSLRILELEHNKITVIPPEIGKLSSLTQLFLGQNKIRAIPPEIGKLTSLKSLGLNKNYITVISSPIFNLSLLKELYLPYNQITEIPPEIRYLSSLRTLALSNNKIQAIPPEICKLPSLNELDLSSNEITSIPSEIYDLINPKPPRNPAKVLLEVNPIETIFSSLFGHPITTEVKMSRLLGGMEVDEVSD